MATRDIGHLRTRLSFDDRGAVSSLQKFRQDLAGLRSEMRAVTSRGKEYSNSLKGLKQQHDILTRQLRIHQERVKELNRRYEEAVKQKGADSEEAKKLARQYNNAVAQMNRTEEQLKRVTQALKDQQNPWKNLSRDLDAASKKFEDFGDRATEFGKSYTTKVTAPIIAGGTAVFKASMDYESAFAGVRKTVDATEEELAKLSKGIREMAKELPASATEIAGVAEAAGQLGIETENILKFTRTMIDLGEATNLTAEQAATQFARFANIVGMSQKDFDRLGSTVVALGNNFATTEAEIVEMAMRLAGAGAQIGLTEAQIMSFATALSSVGIAAEMGGSAFSKVMVQMQLAVEQGGEDLIYFAKVAGMSAEEFRKAFEQDAARAITAFLKGLSTAEERGMSAIAILDEMGIKEVRLRDTLLRAAGAYDVFNNAVELGNKAWKENTALTEEAQQRYETTESRLRIMWNRIKDVAITLGDALAPAVMDALDAAEPFIKSIENGAKAFSELDKEQQRAILRFVGLVAAIGPASLAIGSLSKGIGGLLSVGSSLAGLLGAASGGTGLLAKIAGLGMKGPVGLAVAGIGVLTAGVIAFKDAVDDARKVNLEHTNDLIEQHKSLEESVARYEELRQKLQWTNDDLAWFLDLQSKIKLETDPSKIEGYQKQMDYLRENSGLTNEELEEFLGLDASIRENAPNTAKVVTEYGNSFIDLSSDLDPVLSKQREFLYNQLQIEKEKAYEVINEKASELLETQERLNKTIARHNEKLIEQAEYRQLAAEAEREMLKARQDGDRQREAYWEREKEHYEEKANLLQSEIDALYEGIAVEQDKYQTLIGELNEHYKIYDELVKQELKMLDINGESANAIELIDERLEKLKEEREELNLLYNRNQLSTEEYQKQKSELDNQIANLESAKERITDIKKEQEKVTREVINQIEKGENLQKILTEDAVKDVLVDDHGTAKKVTDEAEKKVRKDVTVDDKGKAKEITREAQKEARKGIRFYAINTIASLLPQSPLSVAVRLIGRLRGFAKGTKYAPAGLAMVGEEGPELIRYRNRWALADFGIVNLPQGAQVFTHSETKRILNAVERLNNIPGYANGARPVGEANRIVDQLNNVNATSRQPVVIQLVTPERRVMAEWLVDDITEIQRFKEARIRMFSTT